MRPSRSRCIPDFRSSDSFLRLATDSASSLLSFMRRSFSFWSAACSFSIFARVLLISSSWLRASSRLFAPSASCVSIRVSSSCFSARSPRLSKRSISICPIVSRFFWSSTVRSVSWRWTNCMLKSAVRTCSDATLSISSVATAMPTPVTTEIILDVYFGRRFRNVMRFLPRRIPMTSPAHETSALTTMSEPSSIQFISRKISNKERPRCQSVFLTHYQRYYNR